MKEGLMKVAMYALSHKR